MTSTVPDRARGARDRCMARCHTVVTLSASRRTTDSRSTLLRSLFRHTLPAVLLLGAVVVPATPATAAACQPASGVDGDPAYSDIQTEEAEPTWAREVSASRLDPYAEDVHDVVISGGGWGHGVGMSQYGAQGAAQAYGCTAGEIISTYFPGTTIEGRNSRNELRLKLWTTDASGVTSVWAREADGLGAVRPQRHQLRRGTRPAAGSEHAGQGVRRGEELPDRRRGRRRRHRPGPHRVRPRDAP